MQLLLPSGQDDDDADDRAQRQTMLALLDSLGERHWCIAATAAVEQLPSNVRRRFHAEVETSTPNEIGAR